MAASNEIFVVVQLVARVVRTLMPVNVNEHLTDLAPLKSLLLVLLRDWRGEIRVRRGWIVALKGEITDPRGWIAALRIETQKESPRCALVLE